MDTEIRNYYKILLDQTVTELNLRDRFDEDQLADLYCLTLNQLPCRYFRFQVDLSAYASKSELIAMQKSVDEALARAQDYIENHPRKE